MICTKYRKQDEYKKQNFKINKYNKCTKNYWTHQQGICPDPTLNERTLIYLETTSLAEHNCLLQQHASFNTLLNKPADILSQ